MSIIDLKKIVKSDMYEIALHNSKKYIVLSLIGVWDRKSKLDLYIDDIKYALQKVTQGFSVILDLTQYRGSASEFTHMHIEAQKLAIDTGLNKTAVVMPNNPMLKVTVDYIFEQTGISALYFNNIASAENWVSL